MKLARFDFAIIGAGITGLATAYHLHKAGFKNFVLIDDPHLEPSTKQSAGILSGSMNDNYTRFTNAHGADFAKELWTFTHRAFDEVIAYADAHKVPFHRSRRIRLIVTESELSEAERAVEQLEQAGFIGSLLDPQKCRWLKGLSERVLAVQDEGERGAWIDVEKLMASMREQISAKEILSPLHSFTQDGDEYVLDLADGSEVRSKFIVLACHQQIKHFLKPMREVLVSYADQWSLVDLPTIEAEPGLVFSAHHGYEWGVCLRNHRLHFGGGRYLRSLAGVGAQEAEILPKITQHLQQQIQKTFTNSEPHFKKTHASLDIWPCDELPLIGPMHGEDRILLAAGYMGAGLSLGFLAGHCLAELILKGHCKSLPRRLWPERLRSLT